MRRMTVVLSVIVVLVTFGTASGAEYKSAKIKKISDKLLVTFEVGGKEVSVTAFPFMKGFDQDGKELEELGHGLRVLKEGNVLDLKTESMKITGKAQMYISQGKLIKGDLQTMEALRSAAEKPAKTGSGASSTSRPGRPSRTKPGDGDSPTYTVVKAEPRRPVVLIGPDGKKISMHYSLKVALDAEGQPIPEDQHASLFKEGNVLELTLKKANKDQVISEARLVRGELADVSTAKKPAELEVFAKYQGARLKSYGFRGSTIEVDGKEILLGEGTPTSKFLDEKGENISSGAALIAAFKPGSLVDVVLGPPPKRGDGKPLILEMRLVK